MIALYEHDAYNEHQTLHLFSSIGVAALYIAEEHKLTDGERRKIIEEQEACIVPKGTNRTAKDGKLVEFEDVDDKMDDCILYETLCINDHRKPKGYLSA